MMSSLMLSLAAAIAQAVVQVCAVAVRMVVVVTGIVEAIEADDKSEKYLVSIEEKQIIDIDIGARSSMDKSATTDDYDSDSSDDDVWEDAEDSEFDDPEVPVLTSLEPAMLVPAKSGLQQEAPVPGARPYDDGTDDEEDREPPAVPQVETGSKSTPEPMQQQVDGYDVPEPFVTPSASHESRASYDGVGEKVADFVKRFKDMQAELTETKQRLAVAEDYKSKYETLKAEMDDILGNQ